MEKVRVPVGVEIIGWSIVVGLFVVALGLGFSMKAKGTLNTNPFGPVRSVSAAAPMDNLDAVGGARLPDGGLNKE